MEGFRNFVTQASSWGADLWNWLTSWFQKTKNNVLVSARPHQNGGVGFRLSQSNITESYSGDKGLRIAQTIDPQGTWSKTQTSQFQKSINANLRHVATYMGFLFEVEVVLYLVHQGLTLDGVEIEDVIAKQQEAHKKIKMHLGQFTFTQITQNIVNHAAELGQEMIKRTAALAKCNPTTVHYMPNMSVDEDLILLCGDEVSNWSLKYASEALVKLRTYSLTTAYGLMGGKPSDLASVANEIEADPNRAFGIVIDKFWDLVEENGWTSDPNKFAQLLTYLLRGDERTLFAIKNYMMGTSNVGDASPALQKDFNVRRTSNGIMLSAKPGASVSAVKTVDYIKFKYKVPGGANTYLMLRLRIKPEGRDSQKLPVQVQFYANNLT